MLDHKQLSSPSLQPPASAPLSSNTHWPGSRRRSASDLSPTLLASPLPPKYKRLDFKVQSWPNTLQQLRIFFRHDSDKSKNNEQRKPIALLISNGEVKRLSHRSSLHASPQYTIPEIISLIDSDGQDTEESSDGHDTDHNDNKDDTDNQPATQPSSSQSYTLLCRQYATPTIIATLLFFILCLSLPPSIAFLPIHQPIVSLAKTLDLRLEQSTLDIQEMQLYSRRLTIACQDLSTWARAYKAQVPGHGELWDRELWTTDDKGEEAFRYVGADKEDMRHLESLCIGQIHSGLKDTVKQLCHVKSDLDDFGTLFLSPLLQELVNGLGSVQYAYANMDNLHSETIILYLSTLQKMRQEERLITTQVPNVESDHSGRPKSAHAYKRRNPNSRTTKHTVEMYNATVIDSVAEIAKDLAGVIESIRKIEGLVPRLKQEVIEKGGPVKEYGPLDTTTLPQVRRSLQLFHLELERHHDQLQSLEVLLEQTLWMRGHGQKESSVWGDLSLEELCVVASGAIDRQSLARGYQGWSRRLWPYIARNLGLPVSLILNR